MKNKHTHTICKPDKISLANKLGLDDYDVLNRNNGLLKFSQKTFYSLPVDLKDEEWIHVMVCLQNTITELNVLPKNIATLYLLNNKIKFITCNLPSSLKYVDVSHNDLMHLNLVTTNIDELLCVNNRLTNIVCPNTLLKLIADKNPLKNLSANHNLVHLSLNFCNLGDFNIKLPHNLTYLSLVDNELTNLPDLPDSIEYLNLTKNKLMEKSIQNKTQSWPSRLKKLYISSNNFTQIHIKSTNLTCLFCTNNLLKKIIIDSKKVMTLRCTLNPLEFIKMGGNDIYL